MLAILVVDDESLIRWSLTESLEAEGFTVLEAASAREALACVDQRHDIGVVLLDLKLPDSTDPPACCVFFGVSHPTRG